MDTRVFKNLVIHELEYSRIFFTEYSEYFWVIIESRRKFIHLKRIEIILEGFK